MTVSESHYSWDNNLIGVLLLAAGASSRMGQPKQLLKIGEQTLLEKMAGAALASGSRPVVVVLGAFFEKIKPAVARLPVEIIQNEDWEIGMGSSIACGIRFLEKNHPALEAAIVLLCDQPFVTSEVLKKMMEIYRTGDPLVVASDYGGAFGPPALFDRRLFPELAALQGGQGAKSVIGAHRERLALIPFPKGKIDLDTDEDVEKLNRLLFPAPPSPASLPRL